MITDLILERAIPDDAEPLAAIMTSWIRETPWKPELHSEAGNVRFLGRLIDTTTVLVARRKGKACGFLSLEGEEIPAFYLAAETRGRGIGKALLNKAKSQTPTLELWAFQANEGARRFYAREGFREVKLTDGATNEEKLPDVRCVWERSEIARG
jgi:GNAT superfamily N-acetyltransferase